MSLRHHQQSMPSTKLRTILNDHGCTQRAAAELLHISERTMRRWCAGTVPMPWASAELLRLTLIERSHRNSLWKRGG